MANTTQYDQPAQYQFIDTYSPVPFQELVQAGALKRQDYEAALSGLEQNYQDTANLKYIPNSKDEEYIKGVVIPHTKEIVDKYTNMDLSDPIVRRQMRMELNSGIDRQRIKDIQDSYAGYNQYRQEVSKLKQKGLLSPLEGTPHQGWDTSSQGTFNRLPDEWNDPIKGLQDRYFKELKGQIMRNPRTGQPIADSRGYYTSAITGNRIAQETEVNLNNALSTPDGQRAVALWRSQYNIPQTVSDRDVLRQAMLSAGHGMIRDELAGGQYEKWMIDEKEPKQQFGQFYKIEKTPVVDTGNQRTVKSTDFNLQTPNTGLTYKEGVVKPSEDKGFSNVDVSGFSFDKVKFNKGDKPYYDISVLDKPEVQNIIKLMPKEYQDRFKLIQDKKWDKENPQQSEDIKKDLFGKLKNTYSQIEKELQEGSYLSSYYPKSIQGIPESRLNNVENVTNYIFKGSNGNLKKVTSGNFLNREFIDPTTGQTMNGQDFYNNIIKKQQSSLPEGTIAVTGEYSHEHPFVAMSNNDNFANSYQISVNGKQYIMSGEEKDYTDPLNQYKKDINKTYSLVHFNPGIPIDENDGTLKIYSNGKYGIYDKNTNELLSESDNFTKAYNDAVTAIKHKR